MGPKMQPNLPAGSGAWLTTEQLAARWGLSQKTLRNWRARKVGPAFRNVGFGRWRVLYQLVEIERFERERFGAPLGS